MANIEIFTTRFCPYCTRAKELLNKRGLQFQENMFEMDDEAQWDALTKRSGMQTVPQIFADGRLIGGYSELAELDQKDGLKSIGAN